MIPAPASAPARPSVSAAALLAPVHRRLAALCPALDLTVAEPPSPVRQGWTDAAELVLRPELLDTLLDAEAERIRARHGRTPRPDVAASRTLHAMLWAVSLIVSGPWYLERRVPLLRSGDVRTRLADDAFEVVPGAFACLPDDPAAALPGVRVVHDEEALRAELRVAVTGQVRPLLAALGPRLRRGPRALWGMAGDDLVSAVWYLGRMLGEEEHAVRAAGELLPGPLGPFPGGADFRTLTGRDGRRHPTRTRLGCCLHYTVAPAEACATCPRTCDAERLRRLEGDPPAG
ncbi:(2Fe-2S)-binding protein [Streptomyces zhihengii]|uniref:(2Fe-2S)-binding protein n=1 Tax=Streptomyces zhihengii TaxID=1818004 RepID=A0ABS2V1G6_9ACTN|nr:(2Fe-2S)-binding protein [Streptomyces zhihengii]MBM9623178.1 (2Fe-2S)-binding protein [Streptomyces zhihengii]